MDRIIIKDLLVFSNHGVLKEENVLGQKFLVSVKALLNLKKAAKEDNIEKSADYSKICNFINEFMVENTFKLIETVADRICSEILNKWPEIKECEVTVKKPWAPVKMPVDYVGVSIIRRKHKVYLSLGSNLGNRNEYILTGIKGLDDAGIAVIKKSSLLETKPYGNVNQGDFINMALLAECIYEPYELLDIIHEIEEVNGRVRKERWGERTLDIDILFYDNDIIFEEDLIVPHPDMKNRDFVLKPMDEIAPYFIHPVTGKTIREMFEDL